MIDLESLRDGERHELCLACGAPSVRWRVTGGRRVCHCPDCGRAADRALVIDPGTSWWTRDGTLWHETAGVFVREPGGRFLFFDRTSFPFALTVPAGHVGAGERPADAARRELAEETGLSAADGDLVALCRLPVPGDACRRGCDHHVWHAYLLDLPRPAEVTLNEEGTTATWLPLADALRLDVILPVRRIAALHSALLA